MILNPNLVVKVNIINLVVIIFMDHQLSIIKEFLEIMVFLVFIDLMGVLQQEDLKIFHMDIIFHTDFIDSIIL